MENLKTAPGEEGDSVGSLEAGPVHHWFVLDPKLAWSWRGGGHCSGQLKWGEGRRGDAAG